MTKANPNSEDDSKSTIKSIVLTIMFLALIICFFFSFKYIVEQDRARGDVCSDMSKSLNTRAYNCCTSCEDVGMEYVSYEYDTGMFHADVNECHCLDNNTYVQIW